MFQTIANTTIALVTLVLGLIASHPDRFHLAPAAALVATAPGEKSDDPEGQALRAMPDDPEGQALRAMPLPTWSCIAASRTR